MAAIPYPEPLDQEISNAIIKTADYVHRNGCALEQKLRAAERENSRFSFLFPDIDEGGHYFYQWRLFCAKNILDESKITSIIEDHIARLSTIPLGSIDLTPDDKTVLASLFEQNNGSKESIKLIRKWVIHRAHSLASSMQLVYQTLSKWTTDSSIENLFAKHLHMIYLINDLLFNGSAATSKGPYTMILPEDACRPVPIVQIMFPYLSWVLQNAYKLGSTEAEKARILRMVDIWSTKGFIDSALSAHLMKSITQEEAVKPPLPAALSSPYPLNVPIVAPPPPVFIQAPPLYPMLPPMHAYPPYQSFIAPVPVMPSPVTIDVTKISVGHLSNLIKVALKAGLAKYAPIDPSTLVLTTAHVEPARLEARVNEFYRKVGDLLQPSSSGSRRDREGYEDGGDRDDSGGRRARQRTA